MQMDSAGKSVKNLHCEINLNHTQPESVLLVKSGLEDEDKCQETFSMLPPSDAGSNMSSDLTYLKMSDGTSSNHEREGGALSGKFTSGDANQLLKDKYFSACNNIGAKRKLTSTLDTFSQRCKSKPNLNITAAQETTSAHADNSDKSEKPSPSVDLVTNGTEQEVRQIFSTVILISLVFLINFLNCHSEQTTIIGREK